MSTGVIFILGKGGSPILASGVNSTWSKGSSEPGLSIGLFTEAKFVQILAGEDFILLFSQSVVGVRIQGDVQHWLFSPAHFRHEQIEILHHAGNVNMPV